MRQCLEKARFKVYIDDERLEHMVKQIYGGSAVGALSADEVAEIIRDGGLSLSEGNARVNVSSNKISASLARTIMEAGNEPQGRKSDQVLRANFTAGLTPAGFGVKLSNRQLDLLYTTYNSSPNLAMSTSQVRRKLQNGSLGFDIRSDRHEVLINPNTSDLAKPLAEVVIAAGSNDDSPFNYKEHCAGLDALAIYVHPKDGELDDLIKKVYGGGQTALDVQHLAMLFLGSGLIQLDGKLESTSRDEL